MAIRKSSVSGIPFGNTSSRPSSPGIGQTYYNGELGYQEIYTSSGWIPATGANDFNLNLVGTYTSVSFSQSYSSGSYSIVSNNNDSTIDVYAYASDGSLAGYTSAKSFTATQRFNKMVVIGGTSGDVLTFSYKTTYLTENTNSEVTAAAYILSATPTALNSVDDTTTISGGNFASDVEVYFVGSDNIELAAKSIVRTSSSELIATRPDNFPTTLGTYKLVVANPGVSRPISSNLHILNNAITAGTTPNWTTGTTLPSFTKGVSYSTTLVATDSENTDIDYSLISGSLPTGFSLNQETGVISGTNSSNADATTFTIRATDAGGNYVDRTFTIPNIGPNAPVWITSESIGTVNQGDSTNFTATLSASDDSGSVTFSIESNIYGASVSGNILTIPASAYASTSASVVVTVRATDPNGIYTSRNFTLSVNPVGATLYQTPGTYTWTAPQGVTSVSVVAIGGGASGRQVDGGAGGGGGGLGWKNNIAVTPGSSYTVVVGAGGADTVTFNSVAGGQSYFNSAATVAGNGGSAGSNGTTGTGGLGATSGSYTGDGGGNGGRGRFGYATSYAGGGGGAGGYSGAGGNAGGYIKTGTATDPKTGLPYDIIEGTPATAAATGSGAGGGGGGSSATARGGGGGVGIYGRGADGAAGGLNAESPNGGSGGTSGGVQGGGALGQGGAYGGGGSGSDTTGNAANCKGGNGAVRIIWGSNRSFPITNVGQNYNSISETVI